MRKALENWTWAACAAGLAGAAAAEAPATHVMTLRFPTGRWRGSSMPAMLLPE